MLHTYTPSRALPLLLLWACCLCLSMPAMAASKKDVRPANSSASTLRVSLRESVRNAIVYNPSVKAMQEKRIQALHDIDRAKAGYLPTIRASAGTGFVQQNTPYARSLNEDRTVQSTARASMVLTQPLWDGYATAGAVGAREARMLSAEQRLHSSTLTLAFEVVITHIDILQRRELLELARGNVNNHERVLALQSNNQQQGFSSMGEVRQVESRLARARATLTEYTQALDKAEVTYLRLTGTRAPTRLVAVSVPARIFKTLGEVRQTSKYTNPLVRAAMSEVEAATSEERVAQAAFSPRVNAEVGPHWSTQSGKAVGDQSGVSAMLTVTWDIYSGGADMANTKMTAARSRQVRQELHAILDTLDGDIRDTWEQVQTSRTLMTEYRKAMQSAREARDVYEYQFSMGTRSLLDVLDTEAEYFTSAAQYILSKNNERIGEYRLLALAGNLMEELGLGSEVLARNAQTLPDDISIQGVVGMSNLDDLDASLQGGGK